MANSAASGVAGLRRLQTLAQHFHGHNPPQPPPEAADFRKRPAVLVCLFEGEDGNLQVILTKRASTLSSYSGEVSLPGGKVEEGDGGYIETALREAKEEIGLDPANVTVAAVLDPFVAKGNVVVVPVIGFLANKNAFEPSPNNEEVESIFDAPLEMFLKDENRRAEEREWQGEKFVCNYFDFEVNGTKHVVWALTAVILITTASLVYQRPPAFPEHRLKNWTVGADRRASSL